MAIEYDSNKDKVNKAKHGLTLALAEQLFDYPVLERLDRAHFGEDRYIATGTVNGRILVCVYTWRGRNRRIISLRKATKGEANDYYQAIGQGP